MLVLWSPSSIAAHFAFCFTSCVVMLAFWSSSTAARYVFCFKKGIGTLGEVSRLLKCFKHLLLPLPAPVVYSTDRFMAVVPVLVLLFIALWVILRGGLFIILPCVILFLCFSVLLALQLPCLRKKELIIVFFVRLFDLRLFWFCMFPLPLGVWKGLRLEIVALPGLFSYLFFHSEYFNVTFGIRYSVVFLVSYSHNGLYTFYYTIILNLLNATTVSDLNYITLARF